MFSPRVFAPRVVKPNGETSVFEAGSKAFVEEEKLLQTRNRLCVYASEAIRDPLLEDIQRTLDALIDAYEQGREQEAYGG